jgi:hypothetical protein
LHVDVGLLRELERDGLVLQWNCAEAMGKPMAKEMAQMQQAGWVPVQYGDLGGQLDYLLHEGRPGDAIQVGGVVLCCRSLSIHRKALEAQRRLADQPVADTKDRVIRGLDVPGGSDPAALRQNRINKSLERIEIPE